MIHDAHGHRVEEHARVLAAGLGVPDFVYRPAETSKGSATREISDGLLVVGAGGLILQVKARDPEVALADSSDRTQAWINKKVIEAVRQANGSRRTLRQGHEFVSMRGIKRPLQAAQDWPAVVLVDHPGAGGLHVGVENNVVVMTIDDWHGLHFQLRSTAAVIEYVERVLETGVGSSLGDELTRYRTLADADARAADAAGGQPILPNWELSDDELVHVAVFDDLVERVADQSNLTWDPDLYVRIVEFLDAQPILHREMVGRKSLDALRDVASGSPPRGWIARDQQQGDRLVYFIDRTEEDQPDVDESHVAEIAMLGWLRHVQAIETGAQPESRTLAVGIRHHDRLGRRYAFALLDGELPNAEADVRRALEADHGVYNHRLGRTAPVKLKRNERCPCGSGRKVKNCNHGRT